MREQVPQSIRKLDVDYFYSVGKHLMSQSFICFLNPPSIIIVEHQTSQNSQLAAFMVSWVFFLFIIIDNRANLSSLCEMWYNHYHCVISHP